MAIAIILSLAFFGLIILAETVDAAWQPRLGLYTLAFLLIVTLVLMLGIPFAVHFAERGLEEGDNHRIAIGLGLMSAGAMLVEIEQAATRRVIADEHSTALEKSVRQALCEGLMIQRMMCITLQFITIFLFGMIMDCGVRFRACLSVYLYYAAPALVILILRRKSMTKVERLFLRWGWAPILAIGVPLLIREWKDNGNYLLYTLS